MKANQNLQSAKKQNGEIDDESIGDKSKIIATTNGYENGNLGIDNSTFFRYEFSDLNEQTLKALKGKANVLKNILNGRINEEDFDEAADKMVKDLFSQEVSDM
jgi:hypothetical protein